MNTLKLSSVTAPKTEKSRVDGKVSRQYFTATFTNPANPFAKGVSRVFWQQHNADGTEATWKGANPKDVAAFVGKEIPGYIAARQVEAYDITSIDGSIREANSYTAVVLDGELETAVFKASGKVIVEIAPSILATSNQEMF
jgi:hypothetical protein